MRKQKSIQAIVLFFILIAVVIVTMDQTLPPDPLPASAPDTEFSAMRAIEHLKIIATEPRLVGKPGYEKARDHIIDELTALGWKTEIQSSSSGRTVENIIARLEGSESQEAILLVAHLDTVASSPGATDDGAGVATLLEMARAVSAGPPLRNSILLLFTGPEETGGMARWLL